MGRVTLPTHGRIYVDTVVVVYTVEFAAPYDVLLMPFWEDARAGRLEVVTSEMTGMESLVGPLRAGDAPLQQRFLDLLYSADVSTKPVTRLVLHAAAGVRAAVATLRTPDAIHVATAQLESCTTFLTNDRRLRNVPGLSVVLLDELVTP